MSAPQMPLWQRVLTEDGAVKFANLVTLSRALLIVPMIFLLLLGLNVAAVIVSVVAAATDLVDGWLARREKRTSGFGAQLDACVDNIFSLAILGCLILAYPGIASRHALALEILLGAPLVYLGLSYAVCRRMMMFHFWSAKIGAFLLFCLWPLIAVTGSELWIPVTATIVGMSRLEQLFFLLRGGFDLNAHHGFRSVALESRSDRKIA